MKITLYTRQGCHLCEAAEATIGRVTAGRLDVTFDSVDIDTDPDLVARYTVRVPVVAVDGREIAEYEVDEATLVAALGQPQAVTARTVELAPPPAPPAPTGSGSGRARRMFRWFAVLVVGTLLLVGLTTASVALITPDVFVDDCARPQLVPPAQCAPAPPATSTS